MGKTDFDKLLDRYLKGRASEAERIKIEAWLDVIKTENTEQMELTPEEEQQLFRKISAKIDNLEEVKRFRPVQLRPSWRNMMWRIAASLLLVTAVIFAINRWIPFLNPPDQLSDSALPEKLILSDGSLVWLRGKSQLAYFQDQNNGYRYAELKGEGLFEIAKDPDHPFIIKNDRLTVQVVGTSFNLKTESNNLELKVLTGKVKLYSKLDSLGSEIWPNEKVIYKESGIVNKMSITSEEYARITEGTTYQMMFENQSLKEIFNRIENKFDVKINMASGAIKNCRLTADFTDQSLITTLGMIEEIVDIKFRINKNTIEASGNGCPQ